MKIVPVKMVGCQSIEILLLKQCKFIFNEDNLQLVKEYYTKEEGITEPVYHYNRRIVGRKEINGFTISYDHDEDNWVVTIYAIGCEDLWVSVDTQFEATLIEDQLTNYVFKKPWWKILQSLLLQK